ncbi:hypothetical protein ACFU53_29665 [Streptomyces sp. NPDC057474]|uniref:hypothetical protein n=1 Tax=Streptomyces sp. NPDC057474 TaxID=3346144 RepID=UPI00369E660F
MNDEKDTEDIFMVAERILAELPDWPEVEAAAALLRRANTETDLDARKDLEDELYWLLGSHEASRRRMNELLPDTAGERGTGGERGLEPLYSSGAPVPKDRYVCPQGSHYVYPVLSVDDPEPPPEHCPIDGLALVFRAAGTAD